MTANMPRVGQAIGRWAQVLCFTVRKQSVVDGLVVYSDLNKSFRGVIQPLSPKEIYLKPEGQRAWTWLRLQCFSSTRFNVNDQVIYNCHLYKVMAENDYSLSGYMEYHLVKDYQP